MSKGIFVHRAKDYLDSFVQQSGELSLLAKGDGTEIMLQVINPNEIVVIDAAEQEETMEFFYVISGELEIDEEGNKTILKDGDYFYTHHQEEIVQFYTKSRLTLLYFTTQPLFQFISKTIYELTKLAEQVEKKDMYTHSHILRVKDLSYNICEKLNISKEKTENTLFAALFHDVGKVDIPDEILNKPGKLTEKEFDCIKGHPLAGVELVKDTYYKYIGKIIEQHHERLDGSGYPNNLKGEDILIEAKIIAVADTYDAMTTDRPYRKALSPRAAIDEIISLKAIHFDPKIVDTFVEVLKEEGAI